MSHSLTRIWIHSVFGTKDRQPLLHPDLQTALWRHLREVLEEQGCGVRIINGTSDHVHTLFLLGKDLSLAQVMKTIKGGSSHWINRSDMLPVKFAWQVGYGGFSVSESNLNKVGHYIRRQKAHHSKMTFAQEYEKLMRNHNLHINH